MSDTPSPALPTLPPRVGHMLIVSEASLQTIQKTALAVVDRMCLCGETIAAGAMAQDERQTERNHAHEQRMTEIANAHEVAMQGTKAQIQSMLEAFQAQIVEDVNGAIRNNNEALREELGATRQ